MPFALWITGLPGSGKSTIAKEIISGLKDAVYLRLDEIRKKYISQPNFSTEEREMVYSKFIQEGIDNYKNGRSVVYDATAHKLKWRTLARSKINNFMEIYVECPVELAMKRESERGGGLVQADLYAKAIERRRTGKQFKGLGEVVGVDVPFEENANAEITINSEVTGPKEAAVLVLNEIKRKGWI